MRVLLVDDSPVMRSAVRALLDRHPFLVCGEAANGRDGVQRVLELKPDIVLLDIDMPVMNGIEAAREIRETAPHTKIVFLTIHHMSEMPDGIRRLCDGFVTKSLAGTQLITCLALISGATHTSKHTDESNTRPSAHRSSPPSLLGASDSES